MQTELSEWGSEVWQNVVTMGSEDYAQGFRQGLDVTNPLNVLRPIDTEPSDWF